MQCQILSFFPLREGQLCASVPPYLSIILRGFTLSNSKPSFKKVRTVAVQNGISIKIYATVSSSSFLIKPLATTVHYFLYEDIRFRTFRTTITPNWNNCYILLYLSQMKWTFWITLLPSSVYKYDNWPIFLWLQASFLFVA